MNRSNIESDIRRDAENEQVINKIKKLLSLAKSSNESEARSAHEKAMQLMVKHNIETIKDEKRYNLNTRFFPRETPEAKFAIQILIKCFFVKIFYRRVFHEEQGKVLTRYTFAGSPINLEVALYAFDFLIPELKVMWGRAKKRDQLLNNQKQTFYYGVSLGFQESFEEVKNYSEEKYQVMIPDSDPELDQWIKDNMNVGGSQGCKFQPKGRDAVSAGMDDGKELKIRDAVEYKSTQTGLSLSMQIS